MSRLNLWGGPWGKPAVDTHMFPQLKETSVLLTMGHSHHTEISNAAELSNEQSSGRKKKKKKMVLRLYIIAGMRNSHPSQLTNPLGTQSLLLTDPCPQLGGDTQSRATCWGLPPSLGDPQEVSVHTAVSLPLPLQPIHTSKQTNPGSYLLKYYVNCKVNCSKNIEMNAGSEVKIWSSRNTLLLLHLTARIMY